MSYSQTFRQKIIEARIKHQKECRSLASGHFVVLKVPYDFKFVLGPLLRWMHTGALKELEEKHILAFLKCVRFLNIRMTAHAKNSLANRVGYKFKVRDWAKIRAERAAKKEAEEAAKGEKKEDQNEEEADAEEAENEAEAENEGEAEGETETAEPETETADAEDNADDDQADAEEAEVAEAEDEYKILNDQVLNQLLPEMKKYKNGKTGRCDYLEIVDNDAGQHAVNLTQFKNVEKWSSQKKPNQGRNNTNSSAKPVATFKGDFGRKLAQLKNKSCYKNLKIAQNLPFLAPRLEPRQSNLNRSANHKSTDLSNINTHNKCRCCLHPTCTPLNPSCSKCPMDKL